MSIRHLIEQRGDIHHLFPKEYLIKHKYNQKQYNQVANYVYTEQQTNIKVGKKAPAEYMQLAKTDIEQQTKKLTNLEAAGSLEENLAKNEIPRSLITAEAKDYETFLEERRMMMAQKIKQYYEQL